MTIRLEDTIVAISTPIGEGAISIIRVSGELAIENVAKRFKGKQNLTISKSHTAHFGRIVDTSDRVIDEVVCTIFRAPKSFTGEDIVEISCHGGIHVTRRVLECILETGARLAEPGEFTQRAFLNGKLDLSQAEAIADLIKAQSDKAYKTSLDQLEGALSRKIRMMREQLVKTIGLLELELDFVEEEIEFVDKKKIEALIEHEIIEIAELLNTYKYGKVWREGIRVALVGLTNVGKSSLLNTMLERERAIVTNIPGTTRDFIEEKITIDGVIFRMIDTAGLRKTDDPIEQEGVKRTWKVMENADIIVLVHDCTMTMTNSELEMIETVRKRNNNGGFIIVNNKIDLQMERPVLNPFMKENVVIETSATNHIGIETLKNAFVKYVIDKTKFENTESVTITNERHYSALLRAKDGLSSSLESLKSGKSGEFIAVDLRRAINDIGEIVGIVTTEDILDSIFSKFCIGK